MGKLESNCVFPKKISEKTSEDVNCTPWFDPGHRDSLQQNIQQTKNITKSSKPWEGWEESDFQRDHIIRFKYPVCDKENYRVYTGIGKYDPFKEKK